MHIPRRYILLSAASSTATSGAIYIGDARQLSVSLASVGTASTYTLQGTNDDLFTIAQSAATWSTVTALTAKGVYAIQPGLAWMRAQQAASNTSADMVIVKLIAG